MSLFNFIPPFSVFVFISVSDVYDPWLSLHVYKHGTRMPKGSSVCISEWGLLTGATQCRLIRQSWVLFQWGGGPNTSILLFYSLELVIDCFNHPRCIYFPIGLCILFPQGDRAIFLCLGFNSAICFGPQSKVE